VRLDRAPLARRSVRRGSLHKSRRLQVYWSFDEAHPALAEQHCLRTAEQIAVLSAARATACATAAAARQQALAQLPQTKPRSGSRPASAPTPQRRRRPAPHNAESAACAVEVLRRQCDDVEKRAAAAIQQATRLTQSDTWQAREQQMQQAEPGGAVRRPHSVSSSPVGRPRSRPVSAAPILQAPFTAPSGDTTSTISGRPSASAEPQRSAAVPARLCAIAVSPPAERQQAPARQQHVNKFSSDYSRRGSTEVAEQPAGAADRTFSSQATSPDSARAGKQAVNTADADNDGAIDGDEDVALGRYTDERWAAYGSALEREMSARRAAGDADGDYASGAPLLLSVVTCFARVLLASVQRLLGCNVRKVFPSIKHLHAAWLTSALVTGYGSDEERDDAARRSAASAAALADLAAAAAGDATAVDDYAWMDDYRRSPLTRCALPCLPSNAVAGSGWVRESIEGLDGQAPRTLQVSRPAIGCRSITAGHDGGDEHEAVGEGHPDHAASAEGDTQDCDFDVAGSLLHADIGFRAEVEVARAEALTGARPPLLR
jgi:hypothetical protein